MNDIEKNVDGIAPEGTQVNQPVEGTVSEQPTFAEGFSGEAAATAVKEKAAGIADLVKGLGNKAIYIGGAIALVVVIALVASLIFSTPLGLVGTGLKNSMKALEKNEVVSLVDGVLNGGSIEIACDIEEFTENVMGYGMGEGQVSAKLYTDLENTSMAVVAGLKDGKTNVMDLGVYVNDESIAVASEALLDKDAYGINLKKLPDNFNDSEFGPDGEYAIGFEFDESNEDMLKDAEALVKDTQNLVEDVAGVMLKAINKNSDVSKENSTLSFAGKKVKTTAVTVEMDHDQLYEVIATMVDYVGTDKDVEKYLENYLKYILMASGQAADEDDVKDYIDEFYEGLEDNAEDMLDGLKDMLEDAEVSVKITFHITKSGKQLVGIDAKVEVDGEKIKVSVSAGPNLKEITEISYSVDMGYGAERGSYVVKTDDSKEFEAKLEIGEYLTGKITLDKKDDSFKIEFTDDWDDTYGVKGTFKKSGGKIEANIGSVYAGEDKTKLNVDVIVDASDKMPSVPKYTDILTMDIDEMETVVEDIMEKAEELASDFM